MTMIPRLVALSSLTSLFLLLSIFHHDNSIIFVKAHEEDHDIAPTISPTESLVSIFYIDERAYEGLPYTVFHRDSGSVVAADESITTYVITTTRVDRRTETPTRTDNYSTGIPTLTRSGPGSDPDPVCRPSTITQGPTTFEFTGTRSNRPDHTVVNQCSLDGTSSATCNLTHVGAIWYTSDADWNGTYSTYNYSFTSGDRLGFAPVTITAGVEKMFPPTATPSGGAATRGCVNAVFGVVVLGFVLLF